ncbi:MFS transporter [Actinocrispum sp. NPDC049592]|uniref:MFS transporter n=1 Tax=Actinocrispum sp. NPDC049592 TaxID=3154835 RepID=UPI003422DCBC
MSSPPRSRSRENGLLLVVMCVGMFLVQLDVTVVNVALPQIADDLHTGLQGQQWVVDGYAVVLASLLLAGGTIGDRYGHKRVVLTGLALFGAASLVCGVAPNVGLLIAGRALQGLGAALLLPGTLAVITRAFPDEKEQAHAVGIWAGVSALALPAGPLLGGALVSGVSWRAVFLINLPVIAVAFPAAIRLVRETVDKHPRRLDIPGMALATLTLAAVVYAVITSGPNTAVWVAAAASLAGFLLWERHTPDPLLPLPLLRHPAFAGPNLVAGAMNLVGIGTIFVATLYLQTVQHHSAIVAGAMLLPLFVPLAALAPVTGRLTGRYGPRLPMTGGLVLGILGSLALLGLSPTSSYGRLLPVLLGLGVGMGLLTAAVVAAAVRSVPPDRSGLASGVNNTARQTAGAIAVAAYGAIAGSPTDGAGFTSGLHTIGVIGAVAWAAALALTWLTVPSK